LQLRSIPSRFALVAGYAAHCEAFEVDRLRAMCDADGKHAERLLTMDFVRYLSAEGISALSEARPDTAGDNPAAAPRFYVEARQYKSANPGAPIRRAYARIWGSWNRLRKVHTVDEAFLVVFRRSGRRIELPPVIDFRGLRLYSGLVDIAQPDSGFDHFPAIHFSESNLRPAGVERDDGTQEPRSGSPRRSAYAPRRRR
jgi:hypothetical protein